MRRAPPSLLNALPVNALGPLGIVVVVRNMSPRQLVGDDATDMGILLCPNEKYETGTMYARLFMLNRWSVLHPRTGFLKGPDWDILVSACSAE